MVTLRNLLVLALLAAGPAGACEVRDFLSTELPAKADLPWIDALELAYPGTEVSANRQTLIFADGRKLPTGFGDVPLSPQERLEDASITEQFLQTYPLAFDLALREAPWFDPGRARNEPFFRALYGNSKAEAAAGLEEVRWPGDAKAVFMMSEKTCAATQLRAALAAIHALGPEMNVYFQTIGGSFNWRVIAGTTRLSGHSFGMAVDFNTELGGYWRWSGAREGKVGPYDNRYPEALVREMERYGFIWGGKWHHFDGMHFEYRPELIVYARLTGGRPD
ncbi:M15 family metallopeptidase [Gemmobacter sp. 24YEA27]|uniref:M15 family metallopeptidase n=1 Tax=Gemmobacter sp. 24YEA27 TaxID=3040672 RepID=UPI0024B39792|nr:M15 family metallopeptidase [Gemmobacter sp. 24YEA27]